jgi:hypothetical protein
MSRRLDIELTSTRDDGTWTWRAAGAKVPKGVVVATLLPSQSKIGDVLKIEADFDIDGITVLSVVTQRDKSQKATLLQLIDDKPFVGVTEKLAKKSRDDNRLNNEESQNVRSLVVLLRCVKQLNRKMHNSKKTEKQKSKPMV